MTTPTLHSAVDYRRLAAEARQRAAATDDLRQRQLLSILADEYDALAEALDDDGEGRGNDPS